MLNVGLPAKIPLIMTIQLENLNVNMLLHAFHQVIKYPVFNKLKKMFVKEIKQSKLVHISA